MYCLRSSHYFSRDTHIFKKSQKPFSGSGLQIDREAAPSNTSTFAGQKFFKCLLSPSSRRILLVKFALLMGFGDQLAGGYSWEFLVGVCRPVLQILTRLQTKKNVIFHTRFQTRPLKSYPFSDLAFR